MVRPTFSCSSPTSSAFSDDHEASGASGRVDGKSHPEVALGCIPVIIQRDEHSSYPHVLQAFEGLLLDWSALSVRLEPRDVPQLPSILRRLAANSSALREKREALAKEWTRLLWREALPHDIAQYLRDSPDAFDSLMQSLWLRQRFGLHGDGVGWRPSLIGSPATGK